MYNQQQFTKKPREELLVFKFKRNADTGDNAQTIVFTRKPVKMTKGNNSQDQLAKGMGKLCMDESVLCLKKVDREKLEPELANLVFRSRDLTMDKRKQIRNDLISGFRSQNFPQTIKVCDLEKDWVVYKPSRNKSRMETEDQHDFYLLQRDVIDQDKPFDEIQLPKQVAEYITDDQENDQVSQDSEDSNRQSNSDNDYPDEDYDFQDEEDQDNFGEYNPYQGSDEDY